MTGFPLKETLIASGCVAILCTLGTWQLQRLHWKNDITANLEELYNEPQRQDMPDALDRIEQGEIDFSYGTLEGQPLKDKTILLGPRILDGRSGYHLLVPVETAQGRTVIINTGWVSDLWNDTLDERLGMLPAHLSARGVIRRPDWSSFASKNSPANNLWFRADTKEIAREKDIRNLSSAILYADRIDPPLQDVTIHEEKWQPRNKHLQYALFWYALAVVMTVVYGVYIRKQNKP